MRRLLARRDARLLVGGQCVSMFGDSALFLVLGMWAKTLTGSNAAAGLVFFVFGLVALLAPLGGLVADRVRKRPLMIGADLFLAAAVLLLLLVHGRAQLWLIYVVMALYALGGILFAPARMALTKIIFPEDLLADANAIFQTTREGLRLLSPLVGAGLYALVGGGMVAVLDAATFVVAAATLLVLEVNEPRPHPSGERFLVELAAGARHIARVPQLRKIVLAVAAACTVIGFAETLVWAVVDQGLHRHVTFVGALESLQGAGAIVGGVTAPALLRRVGDVRLVGIGLTLFALGDLTFATHSLVLVLAGFAVAGAGISWAIVAFATALQLRTPLSIQGRVGAAADTVIGVPQTFSIALGAGLVSVVDYRALVLVLAVVCAASALPLLRGMPAVETEPAPA